MSIVSFIVFLVVLGAGCIGSWKGALYWHNRNRGAQQEDPRDQEIRELNAALSIARRDAKKLSTEKEGTEKQSLELEEKLTKSSDSLSDIQQKYNVTKENLERELEEKNELDQELQQLRRDLESSNARVAELEVQARMSTGDSMLAGQDMLDPEEQQLEQAKAKVEQLTAEVDRWKQHCTVMGQTNKTLRAQVAELIATAELPRAQPIEVLDDVSVEARPVVDVAEDARNNGHDSAEQTDSFPALEAAEIDAANSDPEGGESADEGQDAAGLQRDDLQSIRGVGAKLEQKLNLLGIFSFRELMDMRNDDFERANLIIPNLEKRIERDAWVDQARALHLEKYNEVI